MISQSARARLYQNLLPRLVIAESLSERLVIVHDRKSRIVRPEMDRPKKSDVIRGERNNVLSMAFRGRPGYRT
jgi:hypothetical protein